MTMDHVVKDLNDTLLELNKVAPTLDASWAWEGADTEPYVRLMVGESAQMIGTITDISDLAESMLDDLYDEGDDPYAD